MPNPGGYGVLLLGDLLENRRKQERERYWEQATISTRTWRVRENMRQEQGMKRRAEQKSNVGNKMQGAGEGAAIC